jgi:hypothetical protein
MDHVISPGISFPAHRDLIEQAKEDWRNQRFAKITEEIEFIPLPDIPGKPVRHP